MFKLPIKLVSDVKDTGPITGSQSASGADSKTAKPSLFEQLKARLSKDPGIRSSYSTGNLSGVGTPKNVSEIPSASIQSNSNNGNTNVNIVN